VYHNIAQITICFIDSCRAGHYQFSCLRNSLHNGSVEDSKYTGGIKPVYCGHQKRKHTPKNKSVVLIAQNDALVVLIEHRSILQGFGENRMYTRFPPVLYSEAVLRGTGFRSAPETLSRFAASPKAAWCR
jgi:hypothetical protein